MHKNMPKINVNPRIPHPQIVFLATPLCKSY